MIHEKNNLPRFRLSEYLDWRSEPQKGGNMNFLEQWIIGDVVRLLHVLRLDPSRLPAFKVVLLDVYDGIGTLLGLPDRTVAP